MSQVRDERRGLSFCFFVHGMQDISTRYISYWTDNGDYYYYAHEPNKTYQQTVIDAVAYERSIGIPIATLQVCCLTLGGSGGI